MATLTRTQLRRALGLRLRQPFFRRFGGGAGTASAIGTTTTLIDTALLLEEDDYWNGSYIYFPATGEGREISDFDQGTSTVTWLAPLASATAAADVYEIWGDVTPADVHNAIDYALRNAWPHFFLATSDETLAIEDTDGVTYTLPTTNTIRRLCHVYVCVYSSVTGTITTEGTTVQVIDSSIGFTSDDVGKYIGVYKDGGTANGEIRQISAYVSATEVTVSAAFSAALAVDTKFRMLDKTDVYPTYLLLEDWITDKIDNPTELWLGTHPAGYEGYPLRLVYEYEHPILATEAATTACPPEYIYLAASFQLTLWQMAYAPAVQTPTWTAMHKAFAAQLEDFKRMYQERHMASTIVRHDTGVSRKPADYPFS